MDSGQVHLKTMPSFFNPLQLQVFIPLSSILFWGGTLVLNRVDKKHQLLKEEYILPEVLSLTALLAT